MRVLQQLRNEAHRFGITFHRNKRSNEFIVNELSNINGVGDKTIEVLMRKFKSIKRLRSSTKIEIADEIGVSRAEKVWNYLNKDLNNL